MFQFTTRDLLWLTLVVAMGLGWLVRERQHTNDFLGWSAASEASAKRSLAWRNRTGALEAAFRSKGFTVVWDSLPSWVCIEPDGLLLRTDVFEPSARDD